MTTTRMTAAQALVRFLIAQKVRVNDEVVPLFGGVWAIFGHGNVAGMGDALYPARDVLPTLRGHNEQTMAHAAIAYAKAHNRQRMMAVTTSIGPGATNLVTAAGVAHANRLPVLLLPGDVFANRRPDPVLQQIENFSDPTITANDALRPVSRYWDRITRPEQLLATLPRAISVLTDPADCGPVTLALCQDVQSEAFDFPDAFFGEKIWEQRRLRPDLSELEQAIEQLRVAKKPLIVAGGGVLYSGATEALHSFATRHGIPVCETQAGKSALPWDHAMNAGSLGVTGTSAANGLAAEADLVLAAGTRLQDFISGSRTLFSNPDRQLIQLNISVFDSEKHHASPLVCDVREGLKALSAGLGDHRSPDSWQQTTDWLVDVWKQESDAVMAASDTDLPSDAQVIGAVSRSTNADTVVVCAAGGLPGELHKLWRASRPNGYHVEYGYSCMGYEIAAGLGVKMALPDREVVVMVGDGSYLMANSELATAVMLGIRMTVVILDNRGFGCITRLQMACGEEPFNNLLKDARHAVLPNIDFRKHAESLGATAEKVSSLEELEAAMARARGADKTCAIVIDTDPMISTTAGGHWWDVAVAEVSSSETVSNAREEYEIQRTAQRLGD